MSGIGQLVTSGPLILAVPVAAAAGAITFASPCCLPLIPGYLSYVAGMSGAGAERAGAVATPPVRENSEGSEGPRDLAVAAATITRASAPAAATGGQAAHPRGRTVAGTALFVLGFSALFASYGAAFGGLGEVLLTHQRGLIQVLGALTIL